MCMYMYPPFALNQPQEQTNKQKNFKTHFHWRKMMDYLELDASVCRCFALDFNISVRVNACHVCL